MKYDGKDRDVRGLAFQLERVHTRPRHGDDYSCIMVSVWTPKGLHQWSTNPRPNRRFRFGIEFPNFENDRTALEICFGWWVLCVDLASNRERLLSWRRT